MILFAELSELFLASKKYVSSLILSDQHPFEESEKSTKYKGIKNESEVILIIAKGNCVNVQKKVCD